jgi:predicted aldo/keto reductase-like oxidoreductase
MACYSRLDNTNRAWLFGELFCELEHCLAAQISCRKCRTCMDAPQCVVARESLKCQNDIYSLRSHMAYLQVPELRKASATASFSAWLLTSG